MPAVPAWPEIYGIRGQPSEQTDHYDATVEQIAGADEIGHKARARIVVDLSRRSDLLDPSVVHDGDAVSNRHRLFLIVRDEQRCDADLFLQLPDLVTHLHAQLRVEIGQWLIEQQKFGLERQNTSERDALLLATRKLFRIAVTEIRSVRQARARRQHAAQSRSAERFGLGGRKQRCAPLSCAETRRSSGTPCPCRGDWA